MRQVSRGICALCQREMSKSAMTRHLEVCRQQSMPGDPAKQQSQKTNTFHLLVEGRRLPMYWLHLEVTTETTLATLDRFLRGIWLECCGHLSSFEISGVCYESYDEERSNIWNWLPRRRQSMQVAVEQVLSPGQSCSYEYDFGSTTALTLKVLGARQREAQGKAIRVLARNTLPPLPCALCGKPAVNRCERCVAQGAAIRYLCEACAETHLCGKEPLVQIRRVNSPREGVCGYTGSTNPEYL